MASQGFGARRDTKRHGYNLSHICKITQKNGYTVLQKNPMYPVNFFDKMKNRLLLITVVRKILRTFDMRDCLHTFTATK